VRSVVVDSATDAHLAADADGTNSRAVLGAIAVAVLVGVLDGYLAFVIESPGTSLAGNCLLVACVALLVTGVGWRLLRSKGRRLRRTFVVSMLAFGLLATWWAWAFAMPAAMAWDSHATPDALTALRGIPPEKTVCIQVTSGAIGPLSAPYERCALAGPPGSFVEYSAPSSSGRGLIFNEGPPPNDECVRHLVGNWYGYTGDPSGMTGYAQCRGGP
jgi:hypothetical protein